MTKIEPGIRVEAHQPSGSARERDGAFGGRAGVRVGEAQSAEVQDAISLEPVRLHARRGEEHVRRRIPVEGEVPFA